MNLGESQGLGLGQFTDSPEPWAGAGPRPTVWRTGLTRLTYRVTRRASLGTERIT